MKGNSVERFRFLVDPIIAQIDAAYRRVPGLKRPGSAVQTGAANRPEAVGKYRQEGLRARRKSAGGSTVLVAE